MDDVWHLDHAAIFDVLGPLGKLLITTRNSDVLAGLGAKEHKINLLSPEQATELIAAWANELPERLPASAKLVIEECGFLPLALAMIGAAVRRRNSAWEDLLERLRKADLGNIKRSFPNYPYPTLLRALEVSVEALPMELRDRYHDLAVFPEDIGIPVKTLEVLWSEKGSTNTTLVRALTSSLPALLPSGTTRRESSFTTFSLHT